MTRQQAEVLARKILCIVGIPPYPSGPKYEWWGKDIGCGTNEEVIDQVVQYFYEIGLVDEPQTKMS